MMVFGMVVMVVEHANVVCLPYNKTLTVVDEVRKMCL